MNPFLNVFKGNLNYEFELVTHYTSHAWINVPLFVEKKNIVKTASVTFVRMDGRILTHSEFVISSLLAVCEKETFGFRRICSFGGRTS